LVTGLTTSGTGSHSHGGPSLETRFGSLFAELAEIGRRPDGSYDRKAWTPEDASARQWFQSQASRLGLACEVDRNGNLWAWWGGPGAKAVVTGSHLDTVVGGGAFDGAVGVVAGFAALEHLMRLNRPPRRPIAVVAFADEEGARFGVPTFGSRLMMGQLEPAAVRRRDDGHSTTVEEALRAASLDPDALGADEARVNRIDTFIEVHIEQGTDLAHADYPIGLAESVWPHGRWRLSLAGSPNHAGTARMRDRHDPMLVAASGILGARQIASDDAVFATVGKVAIKPNSANSIAESVDLWLDLRASSDVILDAALEEWMAAVRKAAQPHTVDLNLTCESRSLGVGFDRGLREAIRELAGHRPVPTLSTAAGHDAAVLASSCRTAMIFVRNHTGINHARAEAATLEDCAVATDLLAAAFLRLAIDEPAEGV